MDCIEYRALSVAERVASDAVILLVTFVMHFQIKLKSEDRAFPGLNKIELKYIPM